MLDISLEGDFIKALAQKALVGGIILSSLHVLVAGPAIGLATGNGAGFGQEELAGWRDEITRLGARLPGVSYTGFDETTKMLVVAVVDIDKYGPKVSSELVRLGLPLEAVRIEESGPFVSDVPTSYRGWILPSLSLALIVAFIGWSLRRSLNRRREGLSVIVES